jgi:RNA polymerase sigma-70 factor (ECF subfamily)
MDDETIVLVDRLKAGDARAADELFSRYVDRLLELARGRLSAKLARRVDAEDIVQSAYRSFFVRAQQGEYALGASGELWRLLVAITINKVRGQAEFHSAGKRSLGAEQSVRASPDLPPVELAVVTREPSPDEAALLVEMIEGLMVDMDETQRRMLELRLQGYQIEEIAAEVQRSERGVRRLLDKVKNQLHTDSGVTHG